MRVSRRGSRAGRGAGGPGGGAPLNEPGLSELNAQMMRLNTRILFLFIVTMPSVVDELARWRWQQQRLDLPGKCVSMCAAIMLVSHTHTRTHPCSYSFSPSTQLPKTHAQASDNAQPRTGLRVGGGGGSGRLEELATG